MNFYSIALRTISAFILRVNDLAVSGEARRLSNTIIVNKEKVRNIMDKIVAV